MSRRPLLAKTSLAVLASLATILVLRADNPPITVPPGYKVVYHDMGGGRKMPILVQEEHDAIKDSNLGDDPLDHQKVFSETNAMANKTFGGTDGSVWNKDADESSHTFTTKVFDTTSQGSIYDTGAKSTFATSSYDGVKSASEADSSFATKTADLSNNGGAAEFAAIGASEQNQGAPIGDKTFAVSSDDAMGNKTFQGPEKDAIHRHLKMGRNGQLIIDSIPDRPLSIEEVKNLINHDFKPDLSQPPPPDSKPLNDPNYVPEPLRIEPTEAENPGAETKTKPDDDDKDDPVPAPGTMAEPPENSEPLPSK